MDDKNTTPFIYECVPSAIEIEGLFYPFITVLCDGEFQYSYIGREPFDNADDVVPSANQYAKEESDRIKSSIEAEIERQMAWLKSDERERLLAEAREMLDRRMKEAPARGQSDVFWDIPMLRFGIGWGHDEDPFLMAGSTFLPFTSL